MWTKTAAIEAKGYDEGLDVHVLHQGRHLMAVCQITTPAGEPVAHSVASLRELVECGWITDLEREQLEAVCSRIHEGTLGAAGFSHEEAKPQGEPGASGLTEP